jgi:hypothetical protein
MDLRIVGGYRRQIHPMARIGNYRFPYFARIPISLATMSIARSVPVKAEEQRSVLAGADYDILKSLELG